MGNKQSTLYVYICWINFCVWRGLIPENQRGQVRPTKYVDLFIARIKPLRCFGLHGPKNALDDKSITQRGWKFQPRQSLYNVTNREYLQCLITYVSLPSVPRLPELRSLTRPNRLLVLQSVRPSSGNAVQNVQNARSSRNHNRSIDLTRNYTDYSC